MILVGVPIRRLVRGGCVIVADMGIYGGSSHHTTVTASTDTVTFTVSAADAYWVRQALSDSAIRWMDLWRDAMAGERPDLDAACCRSINRRAWRLYEDLSEQEMRQSA